MNTENLGLLKTLVIDYGIQVFPTYNKIPVTPNGIKDSTDSWKIIRKWIEAYPSSGWGIACGNDRGGFVIVDLDEKPDKATGEMRHGISDFAQLVKKYSNGFGYPETLHWKTPSGGEQLIFKIPDGYEIHSSTGEIAPGIDIRGHESYGTVPPSENYEFITGPREVDEIPAYPSWLLKLTPNVRNLDEDEDFEIAEEETEKDFPVFSVGKSTIPKSDLAIAIESLNRLSPERVENYDDWVKVGMSLHGLGEPGLALWDSWSQKSPKYRAGDCASKWETFKDIPDGLTIGSLVFWADKDNPSKVRLMSGKVTVEKYRQAMREFGYEFRLNECDNTIMVNGVRIDDVVAKVLQSMLYDAGFRNRNLVDIAYTHEASENSFHPITEYLTETEWDGKDHFGKLCSYFEDKDNVFPIWLKRWMIGAVAKVMANPRGQQNRMLVLDGRQDLGKSFFTRWLSSGVPFYHVERPINPEDKDDRLRRIQKWIWEVGELGSTTRKADREALKNFISTEQVADRFSYGHFDTYKPAMANFIGTINNEIGFLNDPTGSRRFMVCTLTAINWAYSKEVDVNQLWAQVVYWFKSGEPWNLTFEEKELANEINRMYEREDPLMAPISRLFEINKTKEDWLLPTDRVASTLRNNSSITTMNEQLLQMQISTVLLSLGLEKRKRRMPGYSFPIWVWSGIRLKSFPRESEE